MRQSRASAPRPRHAVGARVKRHENKKNNINTHAHPRVPKCRPPTSPSARAALAALHRRRRLGRSQVLVARQVLGRRGHGDAARVEVVAEVPAGDRHDHAPARSVLPFKTASFSSKGRVARGEWPSHRSMRALRLVAASLLCAVLCGFCRGDGALWTSQS